MKGIPDGPSRLASGSSTPCRARRNSFPGIHHHQLDPHVPAEGALRRSPRSSYFRRSPLSTKNAGESVSDGPVHQDRRHRGVHPSGEPGRSPGHPLALPAMAATDSPTKVPGVQVGLAPPRWRKRKLERNLLPPPPCGPPRGWNCTPKRGRVSWTEGCHRKGGVEASALNPGGGVGPHDPRGSTRPGWTRQGSNPSNRRSGSDTVRSASNRIPGCRAPPSLRTPGP